MSDQKNVYYAFVKEGENPQLRGDYGGDETYGKDETEPSEWGMEILLQNGYKKIRIPGTYSGISAVDSYYRKYMENDSETEKIMFYKVVNKEDEETTFISEVELNEKGGIESFLNNGDKIEEIGLFENKKKALEAFMASLTFEGEYEQQKLERRREIQRKGEEIENKMKMR
ncbi:MAG: hypothetical protein AAB438_00645 [Patescibacteria group bacterium]